MVIEDSIMKTAEDDYNQSRILGNVIERDNSIKKKLTESVKKVDLSRIYNFVSAS